MSGVPANAVPYWALIFFGPGKLAAYRAARGEPDFPGGRGYHEAGETGDLVALAAPAGWQEMGSTANALGEGVHLCFAPRAELGAVGDIQGGWIASDRPVEALSVDDINGLFEAFGSGRYGRPD